MSGKRSELNSISSGRPEAPSYTKGPWYVSYRDVTGPNGEYICYLMRDRLGDSPAVNANARLIATAPELLEALSDAVAEMAVTSVWTEGYLDKLRTVIAKATGDTP